jgi:hypothetical protein
MPQARSGGSRGSGSSRSSSGTGARRSGSTSSRSSSSRSTGAKRSTAKRSTAKAATAKRSTAKRTTAKRTTARASSSRPKPGSPEARVEAAANRVRKLNEQIIAAGREAGETTLSNYEKFLKSIASSLERGPGKSDVEWISNLATAQAKFIRDITSSVTKAARKRLK